MRTEDHYARALRSPNLLFKNWSTHAASDLVGASGMASADPFGRAALRFLSGDRSSATVLLRLARGKLIGRSWHGYRARLDPKAVDEIATNIVTYGYERAGLSGDITVSGTVTEQAVTITVRDAAAAFDPRSHELPDEDDLAVPLDEREIGGLGIFLAVNGVDQFSYERDGDHNLTSFTMWREAREG